jgi:hypothetical protein
MLWIHANVMAHRFVRSINRPDELLPKGLECPGDDTSDEWEPVPREEYEVEETTVSDCGCDTEGE